MVMKRENAVNEVGIGSEDVRVLIMVEGVVAEMEMGRDVSVDAVGIEVKTTKRKRRRKKRKLSKSSMSSAAARKRT